MKPIVRPFSIVIPNLTPIQLLTRSYMPLLPIANMFVGIQNQFKEHENSIGAFIKSIVGTSALMGDGIRRMAEEAKQTYPKLLDSVGPLAQRGWFLSGYCGYSEFRNVARHCGEVTEDELDRMVRQLYESSVAAHGADLIRNYPGRAFAIQPAIEAHIRGEYALSVPVFFAQAEGICFDVRKKYIFTNTKGKGGVDENIKATAGEKLAEIEAAKLDDLTKSLSVITEIMWRHLEYPLPVGYSQKDRENNNYTGLNRNTLMHGLDLNYATEENSLKAFSMLSFIGSFMSDVKAEAEAAEAAADGDSHT